MYQNKHNGIHIWLILFDITQCEDIIGMMSDENDDDLQ